MKKIIINAERTGYSTKQIRHTMTVGELIEMLSDFDEETLIYIGNDRTDYGWYTYGGIRDFDIVECYEDDEEDA